ncbi:MAG: acyl-CoA dehydrogenase C-terminal domain-containing protein, partial [Alphaproteobacteria bacterium]
LKVTTDWMLADPGDDPRIVMAGATPYLRALGLVTGGWLMAKAANIAAAAEGDDDFYKAKHVTARFYAANMLPKVAGYAQAARAGADDIMALSAEAF